MPTIEPIFSVLIPSIPSRVDRLAALIEKIQQQVGSQPVEILALVDNKTRSIGLKREALVNASRGAFVAFVDDDDDISDDYICKIVGAINAHPDADVIVFDQTCTLDDKPPVIIRHGVEFENTECTDQGATRKPWHVMAYACRIARQCKFPDASYGEDAYWVEQAWRMVHPAKQVRIPGPPLHHYRYSTSVTEAEADFPKNSPPLPPDMNNHPAEFDTPEYRAVVDAAAKAIMEYLGGERVSNVLDVGCNIGMWSRACHDLGKRVLGIDSIRMERHFLPGAKFLPCDLRRPLAILGYDEMWHMASGQKPQWDVAFCLEVAEHLPHWAADTLVESLIRNSTTIVFSAAEPGQGGWQHVNEQPFEYWVRKFEERGYEADYGIRSVLPDSVPAYYKRMAVFRQRNQEAVNP